MTFDNDYAYIGVFIGFLERIVDIFLKLIKGLRGEDTAPAESTTAAPQA